MQSVGIYVLSSEDLEIYCPFNEFDATIEFSDRKGDIAAEIYISNEDLSTLVKKIRKYQQKQASLEKR